MTTPDDDARAAVLRLLTARAAGATICPSEVARAIAAAGPARADDWRATMPTVHAAVDALVAAGAVRLSWRGKPLAARDGPYRIAEAESGLAGANPALCPAGQRPQDA